MHPAVQSGGLPLLDGDAGALEAVGGRHPDGVEAGVHPDGPQLLPQPCRHPSILPTWTGGAGGAGGQVRRRGRSRSSPSPWALRASSRRARRLRASGPLNAALVACRLAPPLAGAVRRWARGRVGAGRLRGAACLCVRSARLAATLGARLRAGRAAGRFTAPRPERLALLAGGAGPGPASCAAAGAVFRGGVAFRTVAFLGADATFLARLTVVLAGVVMAAALFGAAFLGAVFLAAGFLARTFLAAGFRGTLAFGVFLARAFFLALGAFFVVRFFAAALGRRRAGTRIMGAGGSSGSDSTNSSTTCTGGAAGGRGAGTAMARGRRPFWT